MSLAQQIMNMNIKPHLPDVTLVTVTSIDMDKAHAALLHCSQLVEFGDIRMICSAMPTVPDRRVKYILIPPFDVYGYSGFMLTRLHEFIDTSHCLVIQADGFIINPGLWKANFLKYDYIGAPWPKRLVMTFPELPSQDIDLDKNFVGNGGFSLRSKKLLNVTSRLNLSTLNFPTQSEDLIIGHYLFDDMRAAGIRFAPSKLAADFSIESFVPNAPLFGSTFGFHGKPWLPYARRLYPWLPI